MAKILLVEDDKSLREIYGVRLLAEGYDIVSAGDGEEALAMAIKERPDLIVSDVMMPKISGFDMLDIIRGTTETKDIKVIMMTALSSEEQKQRGVNLGADRYLVKSQVGIEDVVRTVHEVLEDAPVAGNTVMSSAPTFTSGAPTAAPTPAPAPTPSQTSTTPTSSPSLPHLNASPVTSHPTATPSVPTSTPPQPIAQSPAMTPPPVVPVTPVGPVPLPPSTSSLPSPTAPLNPHTPPRPNSTNRIIEPVSDQNATSTDFSNMMNQELSGATPQPQPAPDSPAIEPTPAQAGQSSPIDTSIPSDNQPPAYDQSDVQQQ